MINETFVPATTYLHVAPEFTELEGSILRAVAYADVFDYPLKAAEITRYLIGVQATQEEVEIVLGRISSYEGLIRFTRGYWTIYGRETLVDLRQRRELASQQRWPVVQRYGKWISALPFVRMVALTGALAVNNEDGPDLDFLVVTSAERVWLCRGLVMLLVHWARRYGDEVCPNYFLADSSLMLKEQNLYTAHEMAQMIPLSGWDVYQRMRRMNPWVETFLPNASGSPRQAGTRTEPNGASSVLQRVGELLLWTSPGSWVENWEMQRKVRKLRAQESAESETGFCKDWCKGHFGGYGMKTKEAYLARLQALGVEDNHWELG